MSNQLATLPDSDLYQQDFYAWTKRMEAALLGRKWSDIDVDNLAEEIADLGGSIERSIESRLDLLIGHLVKLAVSADDRPRRGWWNTVRTQRRAIDKALQKNPSLRSRFDALFAEQWTEGLGHARSGLRDEEMDLVIEADPWLTPLQAMTLIDEAALRALAPRG